MDNAIEIHRSWLARALNTLAASAGGYSLYFADTLFPIKLLVLLAVLGFLFFSLYKNRYAGMLSGTLYLVDKGIELYNPRGNSTSARPAYVIIEWKIGQMLPWCLRLKLHRQGKKFEKVIWRDSLCKEDWRKLRRYLTMQNLTDQALN